MKKLILWTAITVLAVTACTTDSIDELSKNPISFSASVGKPTRATVAYPTSAPFGVNAYYKGEGIPSYSFEDENTYFKNLQIQYNGSAWVSNGGIYYWPLKGSLKFAAYSPYNKASMSYASDDGLKMNFTQDMVTPIDLMYAETAVDITSSPNPVPLTFNHALTQVYFTIKTTQLGYTFRIKELSLQTVYNQGSFKTKPLPAWITSGATINYPVYSSPTNGVLIFAGKEYAENENDPDDRSSYVFPNRLYVIPQPVTGVKIYIKYDLLVLGAVNLADGEKTITLSGNSWAPNQKIEYAITISQGSVTEITYSPVVTDWGAEAETPIGAN